MDCKLKGLGNIIVQDSSHHVEPDVNALIDESIQSNKVCYKNCLKAVYYVANLLLTTKSCEMCVNSILLSIHKNNDEIKYILKDKDHSIMLLNEYSHVFNIISDKVSLKYPSEISARRSKLIKNLLNCNDTVNISVLAAIQFYLDIIYDKKPTYTILVRKLISHRGMAKTNVQLIAKNTEELITFLNSYPQVFNVKEDKVSLTAVAISELNDIRWFEKLIFSMKLQTKQEQLISKTKNNYFKLLESKPKYQLSISQLFILGQSSIDTNDIINSVEELKIFLANYSDIFKLNRDVVIINKLFFKQSNRKTSASDQEKCVKSDQEKCLKSDKSKFEKSQQTQAVSNASDIRNPNPENDQKLQKMEIIHNAMEMSYLIKVPLSQLLRVVKSSIKTEANLKGIISDYPEVFKIIGTKVVFKKFHDLSSGHLDELNKFSEEANNTKSSDLLITQLIDFCRNVLLEIVGIDSECSLNRLMSLENNAPSGIIPIINNIEELRSVINQYSKTLKVTDNSIRLIDICREVDSFYIKSMYDEALKYFLWIFKEKIGVNFEFPITRLKIYLTMAPFHSLIKDLVDLKKFLLSLPDKFFVSFNSVTFNDSIISNNTYKKEIKKYERYEKLYYLVSSSDEEGVDFYSRIIKKFCFNFKVPISFLLGYRSLAPIEVMALAKNTNELKQFFSTHPEVFRIEEDKVCLSNFPSIVVRWDDETSIVTFYSMILNSNKKLGFNIAKLFQYQKLVPPDYEYFFKTVTELKDFLCLHNDVFSFDNNVVTLKNNNILSDPAETSSSPDEKDLSESEKPSTKSSVIRTIRFYSNIMFKNGPDSDHAVFKLTSYRSSAPNEIKLAAVKVSELLTLFSMFPQIFTVDTSKNTVSLANMIEYFTQQRSWIKELLPKYHQSTTNHETVVSGIQFYSDFIFEKGEDFKVNIKSLHLNLKTAPEDVRSSACSASDLKEFLSMYPEIFQVYNETICLTSKAIHEKCEPKWIADIISNIDFSNVNLGFQKNNDTSFDKDYSYHKAIEFFESILITAGKYETLSFKALFDYLCLAPEPVKELITSKAELKAFLDKHSNIFSTDKDFVGLSSSIKERNSGTKKQKKSKTIVRNGTERSVIKIFNDSEERVSPSVVENTLKNNSTLAEPKISLLEIDDMVVSCIETFIFHMTLIIPFWPNKMSIKYIFHQQLIVSKSINKYIQNPTDLTKFLCEFPDFFLVDESNDTVRINNLSLFYYNQTAWIRELVQRDNNTSFSKYDSLLKTILYYSHVIYRMTLGYEMLIFHLFSCNRNATTDVQMMVRTHVDLRDFLQSFPKIFTVVDNFVSLTPYAIICSKRPKWLENLVCSRIVFEDCSLTKYLK